MKHEVRRTAAVRRGYQEQAESEPETHVPIDAARSLDYVFADFLVSSGPDLGAQVFNQIRRRGTLRPSKPDAPPHR